MEGLLEYLGVAVAPVVHLSAHPQQNGGALHLGADGLEGLLNIAVAVQEIPDAVGALVGDVPGQLDNAAVEDLLKSLAVVLPIIQPVGQGIAVLESPVPTEELITIDLEKDMVRIDGSMAIAWSSSLEFTVERTTKTLVGSAASGEGLVNVYRGTGRVLVAPVSQNYGITIPKPTK